jgi:RNA polymerase sigma-70 factor (ECF subfamily)
MVTDAELLEQWHAGDVAAGNTLFERHFEALYRFFRNKVDDGIDDLLQETLLACVRGRERFRGDASFRTYLFAVARNVLCDHWARRTRRAAEVDIGSLSIEAMSTSPSGVLARAAEHRLLVRALRAIPLELQVILELHFWEDLSGPELAVILDLPEGTVRSRLRRAREQLEAKMAELADDQRILSSTQSGLETWASGLKALVAAGA